MFGKSIFKLSYGLLVVGLLIFWVTGTAFCAPKKLGVEFTWEGIRRCTGVSPEIKVLDIPDGTTFFEVKLKDHDAPDFNHGGGKVKNDGSGIIPKKALKPDFGLKNRYRGPCPPMAVHNYEFTVKALDKDGNILAEGSMVRGFPE
ncbi:MAG: hypothetical protein GY729_06290 [Desulfobacteraceae bacterium]|nr:hypothetical protein [Desulfobacteraceae bacterium]